MFMNVYENEHPDFCILPLYLFDWLFQQFAKFLISDIELQVVEL